MCIFRKGTFTDEEKHGKRVKKSNRRRNDGYSR